MTYVSGFHAMEELVRSGAGKGASLLVAAAGPRIKRIVEDAAKAGLRVRQVGRAELDALAPGHRGAALELQDGSAASRGGAAAVDFDEWIESPRRDGSLALVLDHIEDPRNFGAILRSADAFGVDLVIVPERRAAPETEVVARASAGAVSWVPVAMVPNLARALEALKKAGFWTWAADMGGQAVADADLGSRAAIVLGAEGAGVSRLLKERCDGIVSIRQFGHVDSLNVSVAAGILLHEARRKLGPPGGASRRGGS